MTRCTFPVKGPRDRKECGHRACRAWLVDGDALPRCEKHITRKALDQAEEQGIPLIEVAA